MTEKSYTIWNSMSDNALIEHLGTFIKHHRIDQNKTQEEVATAAGVSRSTLSLFERGETVNINSFIQILRVLDLLHVMEAFKIEQPVSPIALAKLEQKQRERARSQPEENTPKPDW